MLVGELYRSGDPQLVAERSSCEEGCVRESPLAGASPPACHAPDRGNWKAEQHS